MKICNLFSSYFCVFFFFSAAKYREEFKLIIDRIAVVKSENVSIRISEYFDLLWKKLKKTHNQMEENSNRTMGFSLQPVEIMLTIFF